MLLSMHDSSKLLLKKQDSKKERNDTGWLSCKAPEVAAKDNKRQSGEIHTTLYASRSSEDDREKEREL